MGPKWTRVSEDLEVTGQVVGYARVSTVEQNLARQVEAIGPVDRMFEDKMSGKSRDERTGLADAVRYLRDGDTLRVTSLDRLARSLPDLRAIVDELVGKGVTVEFIKERLTFSPDESDHFATMMMSVLGAFAEFERAIIRERQADGIALAKAAGKYKGRKPALTAEQVTAARELVDAGVPKAKVARELGVSRQTLYTALTNEYEPAAS